jgi:hypothetical protein
MTTKIPDMSNRWTAFQCPSCFGLFRIQRLDLGRKGACPVCRSVISIPGDRIQRETLTVPPEVLRSEPVKALLSKVAVAKTMSSAELDEPAASAASSRERRRVYAGGAKKQLDWEEGDDAGARKGVSGYFIGVVAMIVVLIAAGGIYYVQTAPAGKLGGSTTIVGDAASNLALEQSLKTTEADEHIDPDVIEKIDEYAKYDLQKIDDIVKSFLESSSVEERLKWVREPERIKPLMLEHYDGNEITPEGYRSFDRSEISYRGKYFTGMVRTKDFLAYPIAVIREEEEGVAKYLVDWESWTGYCEVTPEEASELKSTEPFLMRVLLRPESYFNYSFSDDTKWNAYQMRFRNSDEVFLAYSGIKSDQDEALKLVRKNGGTSPYLVRVRFPQGARAGNQVEIVEVIGAGWIADINEEGK